MPVASYSLFKRMQDDGLDVHLLNIINPEYAPYFWYLFGDDCGNPKRLCNVHNCVLKRASFHPTALHTNIVEVAERIHPEVVLGVDFVATLLLKPALPTTPLVYLTTGSDQVKMMLNKGFPCVKDLTNQLSSSQYPPPTPHLREVEAIEAADLIICNSRLVQEVFELFFPFQVGKMLRDVIWFAEWICADSSQYLEFQRPFAEREIDVLFIANRWNRIEKNFSLVKEVLKARTELKIHVVGEICNRDGRLLVTNNGHVHGFLASRRKLFALMGNSKTVACPSIFDAAPGVLFEAAVMGCNVVTSENCGNWEICHPSLVADRLDLETFSEKLTRSLERRLQDRLELFLKPSSYNTLIRTLDVV